MVKQQNKRKSQGKKQKSNKNKPRQVKVQTQPGIVHALTGPATALAGAVGGAIHPLLGAAGRIVTPLAMSAFSKLTGFGDYTVSQNSLIAHPDQEQPRPVFGDGSIRKRDREFVGVVKVPATGVFTEIGSYRLSPSNPNLFPKLSVEASLYQKNIIHGLVFSLESMCSQSISNTTANMSIPTVTAVTQYDPNAELPKDLRQAKNQFFASSGRVNKDFLHPIECDPKMRSTTVLNNWHIRPQTVRDENLYMMGITSLFAYGGTQTAAFESYMLYVEYDIELIMPVLPGPTTFSDEYSFGGIAVDDPLVLPVMDSTSTYYGFPEKPYKLVGDSIIFEDTYIGKVELELFIRRSAGVTTAISLATSSTVQPFYNYINDTNWQLSNLGESTFSEHYLWSLEITGGGTVQFSSVTAANWVFSWLAIRTV